MMRIQKVVITNNAATVLSCHPAIIRCLVLKKSYRHLKGAVDILRDLCNFYYKALLPV